jgi:hypothetical protein
LIDDSCAQGGDKRKCSVGEDDFKHVQGCCHRDGIDVVIFENGLHEDAKLQIELHHALYVLIDKHEKC